MNRVTAGGYTRITKRAAQSLYNAGGDVFAIPHRMNPANPWAAPLKLPTGEGRTFQSVVNEFEFYNCNNDTGRYTAFYTKGGATT